MGLRGREHAVGGCRAAEGEGEAAAAGSNLHDASDDVAPRVVLEELHPELPVGGLLLPLRLAQVQHEGAAARQVHQSLLDGAGL